MGEGEELTALVLALPVDIRVGNRKSPKSDELKGEIKVSPTKLDAIVAFNLYTDDLCSGVSDSIAVHSENNASNSTDSTRSINTDDLSQLSGCDYKANSGNITSESSANSCSESGVCTSQFTREIPKQATTGSLKIRLKIRKKSEDCKSNLSTSEARILLDGLHDGISSTNLNLVDKHTDNEQRVKEQGVLPTECVGKSLNQNSSSVFTGSNKKKSAVVTGSKKKKGGSGGRLRNDSLHKLLFMPHGLSDGAYLAYRIKGEIILEGFKQGNGIFCCHCNTVVSPSLFEVHAGRSGRKKPYQNIYDANMHTLHDIAISLANRQDQANQKYNDDSRLTPAVGSETDCDNPSSKHKPTTIRLKQDVKKSEIDYGNGCALCTAQDFSVNIFDDRTVIICDQCEKEYHIGCLREAGHCDLKELPKNKWFCCNDCQRISVALRDCIARGSEVIPFSETSKINWKLVGKRSREVSDNDVQWRLLCGKCRLPEHTPLLSKAISIFRDCFSPLTALTGQDLIPLMVHGKSISGQEFRGMYCVLLTVNSVVVSVGLLRVLGHEVAELPLVATRKRYQGKGYFLTLFSRIEKLLRLLKVEKLVLPATEDAKPMWVNRFGFRDMSSGNLSAYTRVFQLTQFNGTVMLEKQLEQQIDSRSQGIYN